MSKNRKYVFVVGGVMSGIGKGVVTASLSKVVQARGHNVTAFKIDQYFNIDAGTLNPTEHGEVFVMTSGLETDQDMGNYERFLNKDLPHENYLTSGMVYQTVLERERNLEYGGKNVEAVPDIPNEIIRRIRHAGNVSDAEIVFVEIGGTVGEYQNVLYLEAVRMMKQEHPEDVAVVMVSYVPMPSTIGEMKTKPTQYAARTLNSAGVFADFIVTRAPIPIDAKRREKIARFCNVQASHVISAPDVESIYDVPVNFEKAGFGEVLLKQLGLKTMKQNALAKAGMKTWKKFIESRNNAKKELNIAIVGKYFDSGDFVLSDAYISVIEAIKFSAYSIGAKPKLHWLSSQKFESGAMKTSELSKYDGIIVPGGFGQTGIEGKIKVIKYARENKIPYFGLCYGMQLMVIEYARHVAGLAGANTREIDNKAEHLVIDIMPEQKEKLKNKDYGGTMRLGHYPAYLKKGTIARKAYGEELVNERHRHRYEVNPEYVERLEVAGLTFSGVSPDKRLMEIAELPVAEHPFMLGTQFHPELQARPLAPHPLFTAFVKACLSGRRAAPPQQTVRS